MFSVYFDAFSKANWMYISHHYHVFTLMYCGEIKNVNKDLKIHTEKALEACYLGKKMK
jgi:hypothetical protein